MDVVVSDRERTGGGLTNSNVDSITAIVGNGVARDGNGKDDGGADLDSDAITSATGGVGDDVVFDGEGAVSCRNVSDRNGLFAMIVDSVVCDLGSGVRPWVAADTTTQVVAYGAAIDER